MSLLGVASVCKLGLGEFKKGVDHLYKVSADAHEVATKTVGGVQSLLRSGHGLVASIERNIFSGQLWYTALREAEEHVRNGRLVDFKSLVFETPCRRDFDFQWGVCQLLGEIAIDPLWDVVTRQQAMDFLAVLYRNDSIRNPDEDVFRWILNLYIFTLR